MTREQYVLLGPAGLMRHCEEVEAENDRYRRALERIAITDDEDCRLAHDWKRMTLIAREALRPPHGGCGGSNG